MIQPLKKQTPHNLDLKTIAYLRNRSPDLAQYRQDIFKCQSIADRVRGVDDKLRDLFIDSLELMAMDKGQAITLDKRESGLVIVIEGKYRLVAVPVDLERELVRDLRSWDEQERSRVDEKVCILSKLGAQDVNFGFMKRLKHTVKDYMNEVNPSLKLPSSVAFSDESLREYSNRQQIVGSYTGHSDLTQYRDDSQKQLRRYDMELFFETVSDCICIVIPPALFVRYFDEELGKENLSLYDMIISNHIFKTSSEKQILSLLELGSKHTLSISQKLNDIDCKGKVFYLLSGIIKVTRLSKNHSEDTTDQSKSSRFNRVYLLDRQGIFGAHSGSEFTKLIEIKSSVAHFLSFSKIDLESLGLKTMIINSQKEIDRASHIKTSLPKPLAAKLRDLLGSKISSANVMPDEIQKSKVVNLTKVVLQDSTSMISAYVG